MGVVSRRWNPWIWLVGVVVYKEVFILLIPTLLVSVLFCNIILHFLNVFHYVIFIIVLTINFFLSC